MFCYNFTRVSRVLTHVFLKSFVVWEWQSPVIIHSLDKKFGKSGWSMDMVHFLRNAVATLPRLVYNGKTYNDSHLRCILK